MNELELHADFNPCIKLNDIDSIKSTKVCDEIDQSNQTLPSASQSKANRSQQPNESSSQADCSVAEMFCEASDNASAAAGEDDITTGFG